MSEWREDVKKILLKAGMQNLPITFLFSDTQVHPPQQWAGLRVGSPQSTPKWYPVGCSVLYAQLPIH